VPTPGGRQPGAQRVLFLDELPDVSKRFDPRVMRPTARGRPRTPSRAPPACNVSLGVHARPRDEPLPRGYFGD